MGHGPVKGDYNHPINQVIRAAISAAMAADGFYGDSPSGGYRSTGFHVTPDGVLREIDGTPFEYTDGGGVNYQETVWAPMEQRVRTLLRPWEDLPPYGGFHDTVAAMTEATEILRVATGTEGGGDSTQVAVGGDLRTLITTLNNDLTQIDGETVRTFRQDYAEWLIDIHEGQFALACVLGQCASAERQIWDAADLDYADLLRQAVPAFLAARDAQLGLGGGSFDWSGFLKVAGAVLAGVSLFNVAALGTTIAVGSFGIGLLDTFVVEAPEGSEPKVQLQGSTADEVLESLATALDDLRAEIEKGESAIRECLTTNSGTVADQPAKFDLSAPSLARETSPERVADGFVVDPELLRDVGRETCALVGAEFGKAASTAAPAHAASPWQRNAQVGGAPSGPYPEFASLLDQLTYAAENTAFEVTRVGEILAITADYFENADNDTANDLALLQELAAGYDTAYPSVPHHAHAAPPLHQPGPV